ncbi:Crp/Fnr family transcriptional regulator [Sphingomonas sp. EC-HK361]|uniref:Crp/Fnr family transcriptional regulator n=1 Tax=Sphingomonas sp. EC-HK361 TaxID=2038397 RepID=UPI001250DA3E|nr:Crp/Fnr family transcriptional regulator [Sphingomonas sp. EC-HK361]VVT21307.1 Crp/Fnr family transcriptional regulator [Sphingomonas sp. EC-HK361]
MLTDLFLAGRGRGVISPEDLAALDAIVSGPHEVPARTTLIRRGEPVERSTYLLDGYVCRYMDDRQGHRQLVAIQVPGDFIDLHAYPMKRLDHDVATLGPARVAYADHRAIDKLVRERPMLTRMLWYSTLLDAAMHREWIFRLGRLGANGRIAHLMCELDVRLSMVGLSKDGRFSLPITQMDLAEACGVTNVHANRTLRALRDRDLMTFKSGEVVIHNLKALAALAEFEPEYLYADWSVDLSQVEG